ncbi:MAG: response regulator [Alphaproteobacteria bacterium]|nr:response regulator [Alphaproteobacteria bacterium]
MATSPTSLIQPSYSLLQVHILIAEDDGFMGRLLTNALHDIGFRRVTAARNGEEAMLALKKSDEPVDILLTDWRMEPVSGLDLTTAIRSLAVPGGRVNPRMPIVMVTGCSESHHVMAARDAGVTEYVIKPFTMKALCAKLRAAIEQPRPFIECSQYRGPDRRRRAEPISFPCRRQLTPAQVAV